MNITATAAAAARSLSRTARRLLVVIATAVAALGVTLGTAAPSQAAATYLYEGSYSINSYYGYNSGWAYIPYGDQDWVSVSTYFRDKRNDGYCSVTHLRGVYANGTVTGWKRVGNSCSTTANSYGQATIDAPYGHYFVNAQMRVCQSDRHGNVAGTCSAPVAPPSWRVIAW